MADLRVQQAVPLHPSPVASDGHGGGAHREPSHEQRRHDGAAELAVALSEDGRTAMEAHYEQDADGNPRIRIFDAERHETVAVVTPEELRSLTESTGLPTGLLVRTSS